MEKGGFSNRQGFLSCHVTQMKVRLHFMANSCRKPVNSCSDHQKSQWSLEDVTSNIQFVCSYSHKHLWLFLSVPLLKRASCMNAFRRANIWNKFSCHLRRLTPNMSDEISHPRLHPSSWPTSLHPSWHCSCPMGQQDVGSVPFLTSYQSVLLVTPQHLNYRQEGEESMLVSHNMLNRLFVLKSLILCRLVH